MKRAGFLLLFGVLLAAAFLHTASSQPNLVRQLAPGVYYRSAEPDKRIIANTGWIEFRDFVLVIDANYPWGARAVLPDLRRTTDKPIRYVFDTHYHADHSFGNSVFMDAGANIICSEECTAESKEKNPSAWKGSQRTGTFLASDRLEFPQISFRDKMVIDDGTHRVELLRLGPAHTRGDAVAWLPKEHILFTGDLVANSANNNLSDRDADPENWIRVLDDLSQKPIAIIVPGHGPQGTVDTIKGDRAYLADMVTQVRGGIARGATVEQLEDEIHLEQHKPWGEDTSRNKASIRAVYAKLKR